MIQRPPAVVLRAAIAGVALVVGAWFAILWHNEQNGREAADRIFQRPSMSAAEWSESLEQLRGAEWLDPGTEWQTVRASAHLARRNERAAIRVAKSVLRAEPDNLEAWVVVLEATRGRDAQQSAQAAAQLRRLDPLSGPD